jgi:hypothetical protein
MPLVGFEPTISVFDRAKIALASDCEASVIGFPVCSAINVSVSTNGFVFALNELHGK